MAAAPLCTHRTGRSVIRKPPFRSQPGRGLCV
uniref:Uncharacterized protein n=1 Tax=Anguilla anguilla TaxID=7936 RepID=A0A0E9TZ77_ANGAN